MWFDKISFNHPYNINLLYSKYTFCILTCLAEEFAFGYETDDDYPSVVDGETWDPCW